MATLNKVMLMGNLTRDPEVRYTSTGSAVFVEGRLNLESWEDRQSGQKRSRLKVIAESLQFLNKNKPSNEE